MYIKDNHVTYKKKGNKDIIERERKKKKSFCSVSLLYKRGILISDHTHTKKFHYVSDKKATCMHII